MPSIQQLLASAIKQLTNSTDNPTLEAELLLAHALQKPRSYLHAWPQHQITSTQEKIVTEYLQRRLNKEPMAYILGTKEFWSLELFVTPDTLIPRPETELLVEKILTLFPDKSRSIKVADLGTGSGAIALALAHERPAWMVYAADVSENALRIARNNAQKLSINNISFCLGNWCTALPCGEFDIIVSNPPYISSAEWDVYGQGLAFEPQPALVSGVDGLDAIREIIQTAKAYVAPGGYLLLEHGFLQGGAVRELLLAADFVAVESLLDLAKHERATLGKLIGEATPKHA